MPTGIIRWHYWNTCDAAVYVVAVRHEYGWSAYIGSSIAGKEIEENGVQKVRSYGELLPEEWARPMFPELKDEGYSSE